MLRGDLRAVFNYQMGQALLRDAQEDKKHLTPAAAREVLTKCKEKKQNPGFKSGCPL